MTPGGRAGGKVEVRFCTPCRVVALLPRSSPFTRYASSVFSLGGETRGWAVPLGLLGCNRARVDLGVSPTVSSEVYSSVSG